MKQSASFRNTNFTPSFAANQHYTRSSASLQREIDGRKGSGGSFLTRGGGGRESGPAGSYSRGGSVTLQRGSSTLRMQNQPPMQRVIEFFKGNVTLTKAENAWKPAVATGRKLNDSLTPEEAQTEVNFFFDRLFFNTDCFFKTYGITLPNEG